jgi:aldehyde:ferredoxin oxidoreductase
MKQESYSNNVLIINLSTGEVTKKEIDREIVDKFIGGWGINQKLAYDYFPKRKIDDPLAPENPIIISPGVFTGTLCPSCSKVFITSVCPASKSISTWVGSLHFGSRLKWAGYDHLIITGKASVPVYLKIIDDDIEICDAEVLWGKADTYETVDILKERYGKDCSVASIGVAGENLVKIAIMLLDKGTTAGRTMGCTMGSKNLKAIVIKGTKGIRIADTQRFMKTVDKLVIRGMEDPNRDNWKELALFYILPFWENAGYITTKHYNETMPKEVMLNEYGPEPYATKFRKSVYGCTACLAIDKAFIQIRTGEFKGLEAPFSTPMGPAVSFGARLSIGGMDKAFKLGDIANRLGIDWGTFSAMVDWAIELYERNILTKEDAGGLELKESFEVIMELIQQTAYRQGFGGILAEGFLGAIEKVGKGSEYACQVKGTEPDLDARVSLGLETFGSIVNPRPNYDQPVGGLTIAKGRKPDFFRRVISNLGFVPADKINKIFHSDGFNLPRLNVHYENWSTILNMLGICFRMQSSALYDINTCTELLSAYTGIERNAQYLLKTAERAYNLCKVLNVRQGFTRKDDRFPNQWFNPLKRPDRHEELVLMDYFGRKTITKEDVENMLNDYYDEKGWNIENGIPTKEKLVELGLFDVMKDLAQYY